MRVLKATNVYEESLDRVRFLFREFENVIVDFSGGKDSTAVLGICLEVAREMGRLPLRVLFLDQEAEWQATVDYTDSVMRSGEVEPLWYQMPIRISNATSVFESWLHCWDPRHEKEWIHPKSDISIHENEFGCDRFHKLLQTIPRTLHPGEPTCSIAGVRTQESPARYAGLTSFATYKHITWGRKDGENYVFHPIYDWQISDVWKYIHDSGLSYNRIYDHMYQAGYSIPKMRVSNLHHETALHALFHLQEIEPRTWQRVSSRLRGVNTAGHMGLADYFIKDLPFMFESWVEYRDHLLENLIPDEQERGKFREKFGYYDKKYAAMSRRGFDDYARVCINSVMVHDIEFVKLLNFWVSPNVASWRAYMKGKYHPDHEKNKFIRREAS